MKTYVRIAAAVAATTMFAPAVAQAACTQANLTGVWQAYTYGGTSTVNATQCKLTINALGQIANTTCTGAANNALTQGTAKILGPMACSFTVKFKLGTAQYNVTHATLSKLDKDVGSGIGTFPTNGVLMFTMAKL